MYRFYKFYKRYDEFEEMSLDSKYNWIKEFRKFLYNFKNLRPKNAKTQFKKERIMKNDNELYEKYYIASKHDYDADDELSEDKEKNFDYKQFQLGDKKDEEPKMTILPKWLGSKNGFKEAIKFIEDLRANTNNVKSSSNDKKVFNDFDKLINNIKNTKTTKKISFKK